MRAGRLGALAIALAIAATALALLVAALTARDRSTAGGALPGAAMPDQGDAHVAAPPGFHYATDPPTSGPHHLTVLTRDGGPLGADELLSATELGNVVLVYSDPRLTTALRRLADAQASPFSMALEQSGQAVVLDRVPRAAGGAVVAVAWRRLHRAGSASDPGLAAFVQAWLGRGAPGVLPR